MDIMQAIMDIEQKARGIAESADELKNRQSAVIDAEIKVMEDEYAEKLSKLSEEMELSNSERLREQLEMIEKQYSQKLDALEEKCSENKDKWVDAIVGAIIKGK